jgi:ribonuclease HI
MSMDRVVNAYVATAHTGQWAGLGVVFVDGRGEVLRRFGRRVSASSKDLAAFQGVLYALWTARRLGSRRVVVHSDRPGVVAQINGRQEVHVDFVGPYLQVRALLHAYRSARVEEGGEMGWEQEALAMAEAALAFEVHDSDVTEIVVEDLPLWTSRVTSERTPA